MVSSSFLRGCPSWPPVPAPDPLPGPSYRWDVPTDPGEMAELGVWTFPRPKPESFSSPDQLGVWEVFVPLGTSGSSSEKQECSGWPGLAFRRERERESVCVCVCVCVYPLDWEVGGPVTTMVYAPRPTRDLLPLLVLTKETLASAGQWMPWAVPFPEPLVCAKHKCACSSPGSGPLRSREGERRALKCASCLQPQGNLTRLWWGPIGQSGTQGGRATSRRSRSCVAVGGIQVAVHVELIPGPQAACSGQAVNDARWPSASFEGSRVQSASKHGCSAYKASRRGGRLPSLCRER